MKAFYVFQRNRFAGAGLILLLSEKLAPPRGRNRDEHKQTGILTPNFKPRSRLPELLTIGGIGSL